jgi:hypothetical protein
MESKATQVGANPAVAALVRTEKQLRVSHWLNLLFLLVLVLVFHGWAAPEGPYAGKSVYTFVVLATVLSLDNYNKLARSVSLLATAVRDQPTTQIGVRPE